MGIYNNMSLKSNIKINVSLYETFNKYKSITKGCGGFKSRQILDPEACVIKIIPYYGYMTVIQRNNSG